MNIMASFRSECCVCGKTVGMNRYLVKKEEAWCCPQCFKKAQNGTDGPRAAWISQITVDELRRLVDNSTTED